MSGDVGRIGIKELIDQVKRELLAEHDLAEPLFLINQVEVEAAFTIERNASGGIDLQVVQFGGDRRVSDAHTVRVVLSPITKAEDVAKGLTPGQKTKVEQAITRTRGSGGSGVSTRSGE